MPHPYCSLSPGRSLPKESTATCHVDVTDAEHDASPLPPSMQRQLAAFDGLLEMRLAALQTALEASLCQSRPSSSAATTKQNGVAEPPKAGLSGSGSPKSRPSRQTSPPSRQTSPSGGGQKQAEPKASQSAPLKSNGFKSQVSGSASSFAVHEKSRFRKELSRSRSKLSEVSPGCECRCLRPCRTILGPLVNNRYFDVAVSALVMANVVVMFVQLEKTGYHNAVTLGIASDGGRWSGTSRYFEPIEHVFNVCFTVELILRFLVEGCHLFKSFSNCFDAFIVVTTCFEAYVLEMAMKNQDGANLSFARMARLLKIVKFMRAFRAAVLFSELRVLLRTLVSSMMALAWSVVLLSFIMLSCGILMAQLTASFIEDDTNDRKMRVWTWEHYGTGSRAFYTMFEATLSGGWPNYARKLVENVSAYYAAFWISYVFFVVFAVMRVITALFLNNTMKAASRDETMMITEQMKEKELYIAKVVRFLEEGDTDGNGTLDREEFENMLNNDEVSRYLTLMGLELYEVETLFNVLDDGDGEISYNEFIGGCLRLKGAARAVDAVMIMHEQNRIMTAMTAAMSRLAAIENILSQA